VPKSLTMEQAKDGVLALIKQGSSVEEACKAVSRTRKSYENWRSDDKEFAAKIDEARERRNKATSAGKDADLYNLDFAAWRKRFLGLDTYPHQQLWIDVLEGREPTVMHPSVRYEPAPGGGKNRILINTPPFHAKSATVTQQWVTYKLCMNPALRIMIVGKTAEAAAKHLSAVRQYLTDPNFIEMQAAYAPSPEGFKPQRGEGRWTNYMFTIGSRTQDAQIKAAADPSLVAVGINGAIYGSRLDMIILDDAVDDTNYSSYEKQFDWLTRTVQSRVKKGKLIIVGTRIKSLDLYSYLLKDENYMSGKTPWTYLAQPAVLAYADDPEDWVTLWPKSTSPLDETGDEEADENGLYTAWDGVALSDIRGSIAATTWALVYQQEQVSEDMTFHPTCVWGSVDKRRSPGPLRPGEIGGRRNGMEGMQVILSIDPAGTGEAFMLVYAVDRQTRERWVLQAWMGSNTKLSWYAEMIEQIIPEYQISDLVIERQGYSNWLYQDERIVNFCRQRGVRIAPHYTGVGNKIDPDFGVASIAGLFGGLVRRENAGNTDHDGENIIHLPNPDKSPGVKALVDQLLTWVPGKSGSKLRQDGPMALWFAEMRARTILFGTGPDGDRAQFAKGNRFLTARARQRQVVRPSLFSR
jgi:hypothetical protein